MKITKNLLKFMMSGWPFPDKEPKTSKSGTNKQTDIDGDVFESKSDYISQVTGFLEDGIKQMKKDFSI